MADTITINDIHTDTLKVDVKININGTDYADTLPILNLGSADVLTQQLQAFAQETRAEFQALTAAVEAAVAGQPPTVDPSVTALVGTAIPVDVAPATPPATPADSGTTPPADATTAPATDGTTPTDAGTAPVDTTTTDAGTVAPGAETTPPATDTTTA